MRIKYVILSLFFWAISMKAQKAGEDPPKLVVGLIVDQMRFDFLEKYQEHFGEGGFNRLLREGYSFENTHYNYMPTVTAAGHASIYTGVTPSVHGVIENSWYERESKRMVSNVGDTTVRIVGSVVEGAYGYSPARLISRTITDQLRQESNSEAKVISVSLKDRGAILPGGRSANAAYWNDWESSPGHFVSSSYYMGELPSWVVNFNKKERAEKYLDKTWKTLLPIEKYTASAPDDNPYERVLRGKETPTFPYDLKAMRELYNGDPSFYQVLWVTPFGNTLTREFAIEALKAEDLGDDAVTDMLCVSFSTPDVAGHTFGPQSVEVQDIYLRLDQEIEIMLNTLDKEVGEGNYVVFLTSDHGVQPNVAYQLARNESAGLAVIPKFNQDLKFKLGQTYGAMEWIAYFGLNQIYLDHNLIEEKKLSLEEVRRSVADFMKEQPGVRFALTPQDLLTLEDTTGQVEMVKQGYFPDRSGDVMLVYEYGVMPTSDFRTPISKVQGASHGSGYEYDTHVPLLWFGKGIPKGSSARKVHPVDIAPTLGRMLKLQGPETMTGSPLSEVLE
ncbi:MAG: alkaline phosphatase family protein [Robiginitalea sp.]|uniref:alkaline phosphatase family protein n=1 Tax=Robiginitalea sp. TaxID=1902411 RepID=UPI003C727A54